jgi:hypothetical protein
VEYHSFCVCGGYYLRRSLHSYTTTPAPSYVVCSVSPMTSPVSPSLKRRAPSHERNPSHEEHAAAKPASPLASSDAASSFRNVSACSRCRLRKNRCDQRLPACSACEKAGVKCVGYDVGDTLCAVRCQSEPRSAFSRCILPAKCLRRAFAALHRRCIESTES